MDKFVQVKEVHHLLFSPDIKDTVNTISTFNCKHYYRKILETFW